MEELKVTGIVLSVKPHKEKDAILDIFTAELGKIRAVLKGVKNPKAKFKFACQPFCFAEWVLVKSGDFFTAINVYQYDTFYELTTDYNNFVYASVMLEVCSEILKPNIIAERLLVMLLNSLKKIVYENGDSLIVLNKFLLDTIQYLGYGLSFKSCGVCGMPITTDIVLSYVSNDFCCTNCCNGHGVLISKEQYNFLKIVDSTELDRIGSIKFKPELAKASLNLLKLDLENLLNFRIKSLNLDLV